MAPENGSDSLASEFRRWFLEALSRRNLTMADVARAYGSSHENIAQLVGGDRDLRLGTVAKLCKAIGLSLTITVRGDTARVIALGEAKTANPGQELIPMKFSGVVRFKREDNGMALIAELPDEADPDDEGPGAFIRLHGWDESGEHRALMPFEGRRASVRLVVTGPKEPKD